MRGTATISLVGAVVTIVLTALAGCSAPPATVSGSDADETSAATQLFEAKRLALAVQDDIIGFVPNENVASVDRTTKSTLLGCGDEYKWPGGARLTLQGTVDAAAIVEAIITHFEDVSGWELGPSPTGTLGLSLDHTDGRRFTVVFNADSTLLTITTHSSCFAFEPEAETKY
jgi:hypothetical protein